jgi:hypothetical protein
MSQNAYTQTELIHSSADMSIDWLSVLAELRADLKSPERRPLYSTAHTVATAEALGADSNFSLHLLGRDKGTGLELDNMSSAITISYSVP